jgi:hypothetical protein
MKKLVLILVGLFLLSSCAYADILNPIGGQKYSTFLASVNGVSSNASTLLTEAAAIINYLGVREGEAYNFNAHKFVTTTGATIITYAPLNLSLGVTMLNADGVTGDLDWNVGAYLPVQNIPIMNLTQYLYVIAGAGAEEKTEGDGSTPMKFASILGIEFKFSF